jgi:hypothetical protein
MWRSDVLMRMKLPPALGVATFSTGRFLETLMSRHVHGTEVPHRRETSLQDYDTAR